MIDLLTKLLPLAKALKVDKWLFKRSKKQLAIANTPLAVLVAILAEKELLIQLSTYTGWSGNTIVTGIVVLWVIWFVLASIKSEKISEQIQQKVTG